MGAAEKYGDQFRDYLARGLASVPPEDAAALKANIEARFALACRVIDAMPEGDAAACLRYARLRIAYDVSRIKAAGREENLTSFYMANRDPEIRMPSGCSAKNLDVIGPYWLGLYDEFKQVERIFVDRAPIEAETLAPPGPS